MNRLQHETSPYLLQHADNPVDWYPWGEEALEHARAEDKPILLSIGYSACHWCHVMAHESFEDEATAAMMNRLYVNIKVDREERPDLDDIYMQATQIFQRGHGGWPMTVFLTPDGKPFHAGTYFPPVPRHGMPAFTQILQAVHNAYATKRDEVEQSASQVTTMLQSTARALGPTSDDTAFTVALLDHATAHLISQADTINGGLHQGAPKFPSPMNLDFLLRHAVHSGDEQVLNTVTFTLQKMARGGMYDQLGWGFHRYSVDERWLVPHFEKMLYDNAQLARVYLHAYQMTSDQFFGDICQQILTYVAREMLDDSGGFYSTQDADSEGEEGKFFVWTPEEAEPILEEKLDDNAVAAVLRYWDITPQGNFEGNSIPHVDDDAGDIAREFDLSEETFLQHLETARKLLFDAREKRVKPGRDEKMLAAWNGMMLAAFAEAARVFPEKRAEYESIAIRNAEFLMTALSTDDGRLYRSHKEGESKLNAYLEDYAHVIDGLLETYQTTFDARWFEEAQRLADHVLAHFRADDGSFFDTSDDHEQLVARPRTVQDNATSSGGNQMAYDLLRLSAYTGQPEYEEAALAVFRAILPAVQQYPQAFGTALTGLNLLIRRPVEVAIIGGLDESRPVLDMLQKTFRPRVISALTEDDQGETASPMLMAYRTRRNDAPTIYVCQNFACAAPVNTVEEVEALLAEA